MNLKQLTLALLVLSPAVLHGRVPAPASAGDFHEWAATPPMGWNSWDYYGTTITEEQAKEQARAQAKELLPYGYDVFTVDIQWYEGGAGGHSYRADVPLQMDGYGRLWPATNRFPSATDGRGFKPLADYVHSLGLRFGIHLMRGIPRNAVKADTPVLGTPYTARDIANTDDTCCWNPDMYGVDMTRPGAAAYYKSVMDLYASWGVDFIKIDDLSRPIDERQAREIAAYRRAIDQTGRKIVLSMSPGDTPIERGELCVVNANMWRISDDFWDRWDPLKGMLGRLHKWEKYRRPGSWPDADMLPFGKVEFGRDSRFTPDEARFCMTLWCVARAPLIFGGDMTRLDDATRALLTNKEVLAVHRASDNNRQLKREGDFVVWTADAADGSKIVAFFNATEADMPAAEVSLEELGLTGRAAVRDLWSGLALGAARGNLTLSVPRHGARLVSLKPAGMKEISLE